MDDAVPTRRVFQLQFLWVALGVGLELLFIPREHFWVQSGNSLFAKADFYYALLSPVVIWWFFRRLVPSKEKRLDLNGVRLLNFIFGFYVASAFRAVLAAFFSIHFGVWG